MVYVIEHGLFPKNFRYSQLQQNKKKFISHNLKQKILSTHASLNYGILFSNGWKRTINFRCFPCISFQVKLEFLRFLLFWSYTVLYHLDDLNRIAFSITFCLVSLFSFTDSSSIFETSNLFNYFQFVEKKHTAFRCQIYKKKKKKSIQIEPTISPNQ